MKFKLVSDLHLEFCKGVNEWTPPKTDEDKNTVLLLAGDINTGVKAYEWILDRAEQFKAVFYILGNHEFYGNEYHKVRKQWKEIEKPDNFFFLDNTTVIYEGVKIIGTTLWTDPYDQGDETTVWYGKLYMSDYRVTKINDRGTYRKLHPMDTRLAHFDAVRFIKKELEKWDDMPTLIMTHHLPTKKCVHAQFEGDRFNPFFMTELIQLMMDYRIDAWVHGHTHTNVDEIVINTRVMCNPGGYPYHDVNPGFDEGFTFNV